MKVVLSLFLLLSVSFAADSSDLLDVLQGAIEEVQGTDGGYKLGYDTNFTFEAADIKETGNVKFGLEGEGKDAKWDATYSGNTSGDNYNINYKGGSDGAVAGKAYIGGTGAVYEGTVGGNQVEGKTGAKYIGIGKKGKVEWGNEGEVTGEGLQVGYAYGTKTEFEGKKYIGEYGGEYGGSANGAKFGAEFGGEFAGEGRKGTYDGAHKGGIINTDGKESGFKVKYEGAYDGKEAATLYKGEWGAKDLDNGAEAGSEFKGQVITSGHKYAGDVVGDYGAKDSKGEVGAVYAGKYIGDGPKGEYAYGTEGTFKSATEELTVEFKEGVEGVYSSNTGSGVYDVEYKGDKNGENFVGDTKGTFKYNQNGMSGTYSGEVDSDGKEHNYNGTFGKKPSFLQ